MLRRAAVIFALILLAGGCASSVRPPVTEVLSAGQPAPAPPSDANSTLAEDQISPPSVLPQARPATRPGVAPPVQALALYASARDAILDGKGFAAADLLQQAIKLDPDSFELYKALGEARLATAHKPNADEIDVFEKALALRPDDLRLQALLGAQYATLGENDKALLHLRLAARTTGYSQDDVAAAAVDLLLARLLEQQGYDRAALDRYLSLMQRLLNPSYNLRADPELGELAAEPEPIWLEIGFLYEKHGHWQPALEVYQRLAQDDPSNFDLQAKPVRMLSNLGRTPDALMQAAQVVSRFGSSSEAMKLLDDVCRARKIDSGVALRRLLELHPGDATLTLALADVLSKRGRLADAENLLKSAGPSDRRIVEALFDLYIRADDVPSATGVLIAYLAAHPDALGETENWWEALQSSSRVQPLRLATLQKLEVASSAQSAKLYLIWRLADTWRRDVLARDALKQAVQIRPPFAPAYRQLAVAYWTRDDWSGAQKQKASDDLAALAEKSGDQELAAEVRGLAALSDQRPTEAITRFEQALTLGGSSPQLLLTYAAALRAGKQDVKAEQLLLKLVNDQPQYDQAWESLYQYYSNQRDKEPAHKVLSQWLAADPASIQARILQAQETEDEGNRVESQAILLRLFADHDDDDGVIRALVDLGVRTGSLDAFIARLEELRSRHPANGVVVEWLVEIYAEQGRTVDAEKVLDQTRHAVASDPDLLYNVARLYERIDESSVTEDVLQQVVKLDPHHAAACNDLGYAWAERGMKLDRAESLIRVAVAEEPDNQSFLDSLGWVLYKQGRYTQAEEYFVKAIGPAAAPDPVVLDHYGDVLYRMGKSDDAMRQWQRSMVRLQQDSTDSNDLRVLRRTIGDKLAQGHRGQPVDVAPVTGGK